MKRKKTKIQLEIDGWLEFTQIDITGSQEIDNEAEMPLIETSDWPASMKSLKQQLEQVKPLTGEKKSEL